MAGDPAGALVLIGLGVDALSLSPTCFGRVKRVIHAFSLKRAWALADQALLEEDERQVRGLLSEALEDAGLLQHWPLSEDRMGSDTRELAR